MLWMLDLALAADSVAYVLAEEGGWKIRYGETEQEVHEGHPLFDGGVLVPGTGGLTFVYAGDVVECPADATCALPLQSRAETGVGTRVKEAMKRLIAHSERYVPMISRGGPLRDAVLCRAGARVELGPAIADATRQMELSLEAPEGSEALAIDWEPGGPTRLRVKAIADGVYDLVDGVSNGSARVAVVSRDCSAAQADYAGGSATFASWNVPEWSEAALRWALLEEIAEQ